MPLLETTLSHMEQIEEKIRFLLKQPAHQSVYFWLNKDLLTSPFLLIDIDYDHYLQYA